MLALLLQTIEDGINKNVQDEEQKKLLTHLIRAHGEKLFGYALSILENSQDAEDAMQDAFLKMAHHAEDFEGKTERHRVNLARVYLYNTCIDVYRAREKRQKHETIMTDLNEELFDDLTAAEIEDFRQQIEISDRLNKTLNCIQKLPRSQRELLMMQVLNGYSSQKLGEIFHLSEDAVNSKLYKARKKLKKMVGEDFYE